MKLSRLFPRPSPRPVVRFRPAVESLEAREVPALLGAQLGDFVWHDLN
jgi:hypothetical protein